MKKKVVIIKHVENEGPGMIENFLKDHGWELQVIDLSHGEKLPDDFDNIAAVIMLGGSMNVYEESTYPFLKDEDNFITRILIEEIPFLGICLGAQLLAKACGAIISGSPQKEIGWYHIKFTENGKRDSLFQGLPQKIPVFQWHEDTFEIPKKGVLLAESVVCKNQAFRVGNNAYGFQFHIEVTEEMVECWMKGEEGKVNIKKIFNATKKFKEVFEKQAYQLFLNFEGRIISSLRIKNIMRLFVEEGKKSKKKKAMLWWNIKEHTFALVEGV
jgi:GMP synthase (glutamine-hydrolysing)